MSNVKTTTGVQGLAGAVPIQRPMLASVGQAVPVAPEEVPPDAQANPPAPSTGMSIFPDPPWSSILIDASLATIKAGAAGAVVGAALSQPGRRSKSIVRGATVSATVSPIAIGLIELGRITIRESAPEQKAAERRQLLKTTGVALAIGAAALGIDYWLTRAG